MHNWAKDLLGQFTPFYNYKKARYPVVRFYSNHIYMEVLVPLKMQERTKKTNRNHLLLNGHLKRPFKKH